MKTKLVCDIVQDLLPLYEDNLCSDASKNAVEEHLSECRSCSTLLDSMRSFKETELSATKISKEDKIAVKSFRKIRRRWTISLIAILLVIPTIVLSVNEFRQEGICFTNLDDIFVARKYLKALEEKDYEKMVSYMNYEDIYTRCKEWLALQPKDYEHIFNSITIDGMEWMVSEYEYSFYSDIEENFWDFLIREQISGVMIPIDKWEAFIEVNPNVLYLREDGLYEGDEFTQYIAIETKWGTFVVQNINTNIECKTAVDFCSAFNIVPVALYEEAKPGLKEASNITYNEMQEEFAELKNMSLETFEEKMKEMYRNQLQEADTLGFSIKLKDIERNMCYYIDENGFWTITYKAELSHENKTYSVWSDVSVLDGKIRSWGGVSHTSEELHFNKKLNEFDNLLILTYPE